MRMKRTGSYQKEALKRQGSHVRPEKILIFEKKGKMVISVKIRNFSRSQMTKRISPLESSREI